MKTPEEIKKGLEYCGNGNNCSYACPYREDCLFGDSRALEHEALAYIQQLVRERDAAVEELKQSIQCCRFCKHDRPNNGCAKEPKLDRSCFEWHGVREEKTNED